jgi:hypothetical protein
LGFSRVSVFPAKSNVATNRAKNSVPRTPSSLCPRAIWRGSRSARGREGSVTVRPGSSTAVPRCEEPPGSFRASACRRPKLEGDAVSRRNQKEVPWTRAWTKGGLPLSVSRGIVAAGAEAGAATTRRAARRSRFFVASLLRMTSAVA